MAKKVRVVSQDEELVGNIVWLAVVGGSIYFLYVFVSTYWESLLMILAIALGGYLLIADKLYRGRLKNRLARRDARLTPLEDGREDEFNRCIAEVNDLAQAGIQFDDIRRRLLLDEKFKREEALAALEEAQDKWPRASLFLLWREESIKRQMYPNYKHAPAGFAKSK